MCACGDFSRARVSTRVPFWLNYSLRASLSQKSRRHGNRWVSRLFGGVPPAEACRFSLFSFFFSFAISPSCEWHSQEKCSARTSPVDISRCDASRLTTTIFPLPLKSKVPRMSSIALFLLARNVYDTFICTAHLASGSRQNQLRNREFSVMRLQRKSDSFGKFSLLHFHNLLCLYGYC